jgi:hypothetical protein
MNLKNTPLIFTDQSCFDRVLANRLFTEGFVSGEGYYFESINGMLAGSYEASRFSKEAV